MAPPNGDADTARLTAGPRNKRGTRLKKAASLAYLNTSHIVKVTQTNHPNHVTSDAYVIAPKHGRIPLVLAPTQG